MASYEKKIEFFKKLIDGVENSNHSAEMAMDKAYQALHHNNSNSGGVSSPLAPDRRGGLFSSPNSTPPISFIDRDEYEREQLCLYLIK